MNTHGGTYVHKLETFDKEYLPQRRLWCYTTRPIEDIPLHFLKIEPPITTLFLSKKLYSETKSRKEPLFVDYSGDITWRLCKPLRVASDYGVRNLPGPDDRARYTSTIPCDGQSRSSSRNAGSTRRQASSHGLPKDIFRACYHRRSLQYLRRMVSMDKSSFVPQPGAQGNILNLENIPADASK